MKKLKAIHNVTVVGDGGWGTTLAVLLANKGKAVTLWGPFPKYLTKMQEARENTKFLPGIRLPDSLKFENRLKDAVQNCDLIVFAVPSQYAHGVIKDLKATGVSFKNKYILSVTKGIETKTLLRISQLIVNELGRVPLAVLSGPNIASEVAAQAPSTAVIASKDITLAKTLQGLFNSPTFRIYTNTDIAGLEIGGSVKNIIALACGMCDGLGFGTNTKAAIVTRGLAEIIRLGVKMGAKKETFSGLSGLGDLVTTCFSPKSRNRTVGEALGRGKTIEEIKSQMEMVAEGVETVKAVYPLKKKYKVDMPITDSVYQIIYQNKNPAQAFQDLMQRKPKSE